MSDCGVVRQVLFEQVLKVILTNALVISGHNLTFEQTDHNWLWYATSKFVSVLNISQTRKSSSRTVLDPQLWHWGSLCSHEKQTSGFCNRTSNWSWNLQLQNPLVCFSWLSWILKGVLCGAQKKVNFFLAVHNTPSWINLANLGSDGLRGCILKNYAAGQRPNAVSLTTHQCLQWATDSLETYNGWP